MLTSSGGYSADVSLHLVLDGHVLPLAQVGPSYCILREPVQFEPSGGQIVIVVDGREKRVEAFFPQGGSATDPLLPYVFQTPAALAH
jgi:hypothetical protein